jgi:hypothetical protein
MEFSPKFKYGLPMPLRTLWLIFLFVQSLCLADDVDNRILQLSVRDPKIRLEAAIALAQMGTESTRALEALWNTVKPGGPFSYDQSGAAEASRVVALNAIDN